MTSTIDFCIDSQIAPADAEDVLKKLIDFTSSTQTGKVGISGTPSLSNLPTQTALQLLLSTIREIGSSRDFRDFLDMDTLNFCTEILGENWHAKILGANIVGHEDD